MAYFVNLRQFEKFARVGFPHVVREGIAADRK